MTKYSSNLRKRIISSYLNHENSLRGLAKEYNIDFGMIKKWADLAEAQGLMALEVKHTKRTFSSQFKLNVVRCYLTNEIGASKTAAKFDLSTSQVHAWTKHFEEQGITGLLAKKRGRPNKMIRKKRHRKPAKKLSLSEKQRYEEKILKQEAQIKHLKMQVAETKRLKVENLVLKKVAARYPHYLIGKKHK